MLDPWTALSLAASITQFVDFGFRFVSNVKEIAGDGSTIDHRHIQLLSQDLVAIDDTLSEQFRLQQTKLSDEEQALQNLSDQCQLEAKSLLELLTRIKGSSKSRWANIRTAVLTAWNNDDVAALETRLSKYREQLAVRLLVLINSNSNEQHQKIVEVLSLSHSMKATALSESTSAERRHQETIAAILKLQNGQTRTITRPMSRTSTIDFSKPEKITQHSIVYSGVASAQQATDSSGYQYYEGSLLTFNDKIIGSLYFREINFREDSIDPAFASTFSWMFQEDSTSGFINWLKEGNGCYWINGKAGSGKSTLMKHIYAHPATFEALNLWAQSSRLFTSAFYFWNAGTSLQKSQEGLFRSVLYAILDQRTNLIPVLFPKLVRAITLQPNQALSITFSELKQAMQALTEAKDSSIKTCLFIDGVDEFVGDHVKLSELLRSIASSENIKIVLSSRPIPACVQIFSRCPGIRLQDLTTHDIEVYVQKKLAEHELMKDMEISDSGCNKIFVDEVIDKASGVFLWVVLVVKSLLDGLHNYDGFDDLMHRLHELPSDLELLYEHMLGLMAPTYQEEASIILRCFVRHYELQLAANMTAIQMYHMLETVVEDVFDLQVRSMSSIEENRQTRVAEGRLRSRCCGLLETRSMLNGRVEVTALHRTVRDFLQQDTMSKRLVDAAERRKVNVDEMLLASYIAAVKTFSRQYHAYEDSVCTDVSLDYAVPLKYGSTGTPEKLLDEVDKMMGEDFWGNDFYAFSTMGLSLLLPKTWLYRIALHGLGDYLIWRLDQLPPHDAQEAKDSMLCNLLIAVIENKLLYEKVVENRPNGPCDSILALLRNGARIDKEVKISDAFLSVRNAGLKVEKGGTIQTSSLLLSIMNSGFESSDALGVRYMDVVPRMIEAALLSPDSLDHVKIRAAIPGLIKRLPLASWTAYQRAAVNRLLIYTKISTASNAEQSPDQGTSRESTVYDSEVGGMVPPVVSVSTISNDFDVSRGKKRGFSRLMAKLRS